MQLDKKLEAEIREYCKVNGMKPTEYVNGLLKKAFISDKFGEDPINLPIYKDPITGFNIIGNPPKDLEDDYAEIKEKPIEISVMDLIDEEKEIKKEENKKVAENKVTKPRKRVLK